MAENELKIDAPEDPSNEQVSKTVSDSDPELEKEERKLTQTDHVNKKLLGSFLQRLNQNDNSVAFGLKAASESSDWDSEQADFDKDSSESTVDQNFPSIASVAKSANTMSFQRYFILGISGATNSGKSTVAAMLQKKIPCSEVICQDDYFREAGDPRVEKEDDGTENWEKLSALDTDTMVKFVQNWTERQQSKTSTSILIVEGFLIFNHSALTRLFDKKYFVQIDERTCKERRMKRAYNPPDPPGYFEKVAWPFYLKNLDDLKDQKDIEYLDGSADLSTLCEQIVTGVRQALSQKM